MEQGLILLIAALMVVVLPGAAQLFYATDLQSDTQVNVTQEGCGVTKLCAAQPSKCDPAGNVTCLFTSLVISNGTNLFIQLRGDSVGAVGLGLNTSQGVVMGLLCAQNYLNNMITFFGVSLKTVTNIRGLAQNNAIYCEFSVSNAVSTDTIFDIFLFARGFNNSSFTNVFNVTNLGTTTTAPTTMMPHNMTTAPMMMPHNMTTAPMMMPHNMTTAPMMMPHNMTTAPTMMMPHNMTTAPTMMVPGNMTGNMTAPTTMKPHTMTTAASTTLHPHSLLLLLSVVTLAALQRT
ncbi:putative ferric-chelate reductase 1 [Mastacembelus armatus]|uniref:putative ferric-chelate reductase 1 n=1 Tax=Mastacembelus armatus TaxID=205130 RepID=UPI000E454D32|nr:putative ferric-chelate reductase 1 [Mastacembelus armatus]